MTIEMKVYEGKPVSCKCGQSMWAGMRTGPSRNIQDWICSNDLCPHWCSIEWNYTPPHPDDEITEYEEA